MLIFIRHSDDQDDDPTHALDPKLTKEGKHLAYKEGKALIERYGLPTIIYCSPFRRTKETLEYMLRKRSTSNMAIIYDNRLSRYFSSKEKKHPDIDRSTKKADVPIFESYGDFKERARDLTHALDVYIGGKEIVWCITHSSFYKKIASIYKAPIPDHIPFMHHFQISN